LWTECLRQACEVMNIRLMDHVIVTDGRYYSYADEGKI
jgi:DNA repair protein RadC